MWFHIKPTRLRAPPLPIYLEGSPLQHVNHHKYLGMHFDSQLKWNIHVANTCKKMSYYLYLINYHHWQFPSHILKMLADTLVFSQLYALPTWGPSLGVDAASQLQHLCNHAVWVTCGLKKYYHVSTAWTAIILVLIVLDPPFQFGSNHSYATRWPPHFCNIFQYSTSFGQRYFRSQATTWWNHLLHSLFDFSPIDFHIIYTNIYLICDYIMLL